MSFCWRHEFRSQWIYCNESHCLLHVCACDQSGDQYRALERLACSSLALQLHELVMCLLCVRVWRYAGPKFQLSSGRIGATQSPTRSLPAGLSAPVFRRLCTLSSPSSTAAADITWGILRMDQPDEWNLQLGKYRQAEGNFKWRGRWEQTTAGGSNCLDHTVHLKSGTWQFICLRYQ